MSSKTRRHGRGEGVGRHHDATPHLRDYVVPPATEVVVTRPDGSVEFIPPMKPQLASPSGRRRSKKKSKKPQ